MEFTKATSTGNSNGWQNFYVNLAMLGYHFNINYGDTILYRFTFISDSTQTNKDGLMFDDFHFEDWVESISEFESENLITLTPIPASDKLKVKRKNISVDLKN